ncbi:MAG: uridine diphosphate-N-acetylglucosamine-binding protein YvcK [Thermotogaceae bacterium]|nr:uridine diphosphate-N-acetylglucosamine-binding protein YvcK [Thermotogaceae bacterium]
MLEKRWWWNIGTSTDKPKVVAIGGGTGMSTLLKGLKKYNIDITAIVSVTDEGGSSGILRKELKIPPPGDVRNNFVALSENEKALEKLFNYRFKDGSLNGHTVGNIILAALSKIHGGSLSTAVKYLSDILAIKGKILPVSDDLIRLVATMEDGTEITGEVNIVESKKRIAKVSLDKKVKAQPEVIKSLKEADSILIGPGSLYTSIITNFLVEGVKEAIISSKAKIFYIANLMTQPGETDGMKLSDHIKEVEKYMGKKIDVAIVNSGIPPANILKRYEREGYYPVKLDVENVKRMLVMEPMIKLEKDIFDGKIKLRHDPDKLASVVVGLIR